MEFLAKTKLNIKNVVISRALPDSYTSHKDVEKKKESEPRNVAKSNKRKLMLLSK